jgi:hypothetical protein
VGVGDVKACTEGCADASKCVETLQSVDLDNWTCIDGGCRYTGCLSNAECEADFGVGSLCVPSNRGPAMCVRACQAPADCVIAGTPPTRDADNFACTDGLCVYLGCLSNDECTAAEGMSAICTDGSSQNP